MSVNVDLQNTLRNVLENAVSGVLLHKRIIALVRTQRPNLQIEQKKKLIIKIIL